MKRRLRRAHLAEQIEGWALVLTALITGSDIDPVLQLIYALPVGHRWNRASGLTLLGDAAHLTSKRVMGCSQRRYAYTHEADRHPRRLLAFDLITSLGASAIHLTP